MAATLSYQATVTSGTGASSYSLSFTAASAAGQERLVAVCGISQGAASTSYSGVTIDGQTATAVTAVVKIVDSGGTAGPMVQFWRATGTSGTSFNVVVSVSGGTLYDCRTILWNMSGAGTLLASGSSTASAGLSGATKSFDVNTVTNGAVAAACMVYDCIVVPSWGGGVTQRVMSTPLYTNDYHTGADVSALGSGSTPMSVQMVLSTMSGSTLGFAASSVSFNPAASGTTLTAAAGSYAVTGSAAAAAYCLVAEGRELMRAVLNPAKTGFALLVLIFLLLCVVAAVAANVNLAWNPSTDDPGGSGLAGYKVYRNGVLIGTSATNSYTDATSVDGNIYRYTVSAYDVAGNESGQSLAANITMPTVSFTPLHKYFIAPTGCSDANAGTSAGAPWCTANHAVVCGDVIVAAAGNYTTEQFGISSNFGTVSGCPSTTGGIDGTGGIYFAVLLCEGPDLESCRVDGGSGPAFEVQKSNWSIQGFRATMNTNGDRGCFSALGTSSGTTWHHIAWINNIASTCDLAGFVTGNIGISDAGPDQTAIVGNIVYNGANSLGPFGVCGSGISVIPANNNTDGGTHIFLSQNFVYKSTNSPGATECTVGPGGGGGPTPHSDGNGLIFDTWAGNPPAFNKKGVVKNNVLWLNGNACFQVFPQGDGTTADNPQIYFYNNTCWGNNQDARAACGGELYLHDIYPKVALGGIYSITNNIMQATLLSCGSAGVFSVYGALVAATVNPLPPPITISGNYFFSSAAPTHPGVDGDPGFNTYVVNDTSCGAGTPPCFNASWIFGTNTKADPGLTNPSSLPTTAPVCTGYVNAVVCMNANYNVYTLVKPTVAATTLGYQPPVACAADADYPTWLKGIVYLRVSGGNIVVGNELITKPCNL